MDFICIEKLSFSYGDSKQLSLGNIDLNLKKGEFTVVCGDSKSGKTSLLYLISGIVPFFYPGRIDGKVSMGGTDLTVNNLEEIKSKVKIVLDNPYAQISGMASTVFEEVALGISGNLNIKRIEEKVEEALSLTGISHLRKRNPSILSGGETQRMVIASQLVCDFEVLLLDEPVSKLDPEGKTDIFRLMEKISKEGKTVIISGNEIERATLFADRLIVMADGNIVKDGSSKIVSSDPDLTKYGVELQKYTQAALTGMGKGLWEKERRLPSTYGEALEGFKWI